MTREVRLFLVLEEEDARDFLQALRLQSSSDLSEINRLQFIGTSYSDRSYASTATAGLNAAKNRRTVVRHVERVLEDAINETVRTS